METTFRASLTAEKAKQVSVTFVALSHFCVKVFDSWKPVFVDLNLGRRRHELEAVGRRVLCVGGTDEGNSVVAGVRVVVLEALWHLLRTVEGDLSEKSREQTSIWFSRSHPEPLD